MIEHGDLSRQTSSMIYDMKASCARLGSIDRTIDKGLMGQGIDGQGRVTGNGRSGRSSGGAPRRRSCRLGYTATV